MDTTDDLTYLNYLGGDKSDTFLLQSTDEALGVQDPTLNGQTFFGELDDGARIWAVDSLPVLLNGSNRTDDHAGDEHFNPSGSKIILSELEQVEDCSESCIENAEGLSYPIEIPGDAFITSNGGLFLANEVLLQMNLPNEMNNDAVEEETQENSLEENNTTEIFLEQGDTVYQVESRNEIEPTIIEEEEEEEEEGAAGGGHFNTEVIQLLNTDGTIINIDKNLLISSNKHEVKKQEEQPVSIGQHIERITAYKCKRCGYLSETLIDITKHINSKVCEEECETVIEVGNSKTKVVLNVKDTKNNKQKLVLLCSECNQGYCTTAELKNHMIMEHELSSADNKTKNDKLNNAKEVNKESKKQYLSIIKNQQKASRKVKCSIKGCELRFALDEYRIRHEKCHVNSQKKQFKCPACDKTFSVWRICSLHMWKCHEIDVGLLSCVICSYKTLSPFKLWPHLLTHEDKRQYLCNECGKSFKQFTQLRNHQVFHLANTEDAPNWICQQRCNICGNIFSDTKSLKKHIQSVHNKFKPYVCNICGHKTARKAMLELHLRQHTGEKPYQCQLCPYRTGDHNSLRRHLMRHSGGKKYSCPYCNYQSIQTTAYKHHIILKHPGKEGIFRCTYCSFGTVNEHTYRTHIKEHERNIAGNENKEPGKKISALIEKCIQPETSTSSEEIVPNQVNQAKRSNKSSKLEEDDETQHGFLTSINNDNETVDTGGITIPAGLELQM
ncbi:zinc finger protein [Holotrichia oblita]|uniref:Zinc finger protein n=1 Tax=Holotrichia oblita TaxID=644536 RepID=A0ACB9TX82_HOLOL|nr:zinc finger protein [Holotrichia oblita]